MAPPELGGRDVAGHVGAPAAAGGGPGGEGAQGEADVLEALEQGGGAYLGLLEQVERLTAKARPYGAPGAQASARAALPALRALSRHATRVSPQRHGGLLERLLGPGASVWEVDGETRQAWLLLVQHLMLAHAALFHHCIDFLVGNFTPPPGRATDQASSSTAAWAPAPEDLAVLGDVQRAVRHVLEKIPTAHQHLLDTILSQMPHEARDCATLCLYFKSVLWIAAGPGRSMCDKLLGGIVERVLEIDVSIKWHDIVEKALLAEQGGGGEHDEEAEGPVELEEADLFDILGGPPGADDGMDEDSMEDDRGTGWGGTAGAAGAAAGGGSKAKGQAQPQAVDPSYYSTSDETADKLDSVMELLFQFLKEEFDKGNGAKMRYTLLGIFSQLLLPAHRSKFTQFLMFYACARAPQEGSQSFIDQLLISIQDTNRSDLIRTASVAYLSSFIARAAFVPYGVIADALQKLVGVCVIYCGKVRPDAPCTEMRDEDAVFYACCQGLFYVLCYVMHPMCARGYEGLLRQLPMNVLMAHNLMPLHFCLPSVADEFTKQATALGLADAWVPGGAPLGGAERPRRALEMFFPFDPYLLHRSIRFLQPAEWFVDWKKATKMQRGEEVWQAGTEVAGEDADLHDDAPSDKASSGFESSDDEDDFRDYHSDDDFDGFPKLGGPQRPIPIAQRAITLAGELSPGMKRSRGTWSRGGTGYSSSPTTAVGSQSSADDPSYLGTSPLGAMQFAPKAKLMNPKNEIPSLQDPPPLVRAPFDSTSAQQ